MSKGLLLLITGVLAGVVARSSPNAGNAELMLKTLAESRYSNNVIEDNQLDVPGLIAKYGYPVEVHTVVTADGYILEMHRIPHGRNNYNNPNQKRPAVMVMHGLLSSSADFLIMGPGSALGYQLAEAGYDVWFGNARGNYYSRNHMTLNPDENDFWRFSWDEIGNYDLPASIDYILEITGERKIHYIGHSQGGTAFLVLNSLRPEYNQKLLSFQGLAPAAYFTHSENKMFNTLASYEAIIESAAWAMGISEIFGKRDFVSWFQENVCGKETSVDENLCNLGLYGFPDMEHFNSTMILAILGHTPAGASIRQVAHYGQVIRFDAFRRYNHLNPFTNLAIYGRLTPPEYDLSNVTVPAYLYYGLADKQVDYRDLLKLAENLPNVISVKKIDRDTFNHYGFLWDTDATEQVYDYVVSSLRDADSRFF